jgi:ribosomal protein S18 acetylase RimI-like enzyme
MTDINKEILSLIKIRHATRNDLSAMEWDGEYIHFRRLYADAYAYAERGKSVLWIVEVPSIGLMGQVFISLNGGRLKFTDFTKQAYVYGFRVKPPYRNQGIGTQMMNVVEMDLIKRKICWVTLNVSRDNRAARRFYERIGYRIYGEDPGRWSYKDHTGKQVNVVEPAWRMSKKIK